ncbi:enoyl-CoA hydratase/isomerase family protein [Plectosphaerella plurivora]|uniref:Enoyl-CoA hydratase/isomerase family protein n=1 Tax=Plectosphaerella plurivora TaxID=936078 RepID=A0A9P9AHN2_9PEZI|nr:enoyl-CoA hydratase/isomerase family protein [Plectosphaerella plurivora]
MSVSVTGGRWVPPASYAALAFKDVKIFHVPAEAPEATKVLIIAFNRPEKYNAVIQNLLNELKTAYKLVEKDDRVRAVVLTGMGKAFCAGADLEVGFSSLMAFKKSPETASMYRDPGGPIALAIANSSKPTIVALNGPAAGFGLTITLPAAIRVAWRDAKVSLPFARRGLVLEACSAFYLPRLLGLSKATHLAVAGGSYPASDPLVSPLFSKLLDTPEATVAYAVEIATDIAENTSPTSTKLMRDMLLRGPGSPEEMHKLDSSLFISVIGSKDNMEGIESFMKKRRPEFGGSFDSEAVPSWPWWGSGRGGPVTKL